MRRLLGLALGLCLFASPALAGLAIISGTGTGGAQQDWIFSSGTTVTSALTSSVAAGSLLVEIGISNITGTATTGFTCSDTKGDTFTLGTLDSQIAAGVQLCWTVTGSSMTTSDSVTITQNASLAQLSGMLGAFSGEDTSTPLDVQTVADSGGVAQTSWTVGPTGAIACPGGGANCNLAICAMIWKSNGTMTTDAAYTRFGTGTSAVPWSFGYRLLSSTNATQSCTDSNTTSDRVSAALVVFKAAAAGGSTTPAGLTLMGAGP